MSKQDLLKKINDKVTDVDIATELIEDVEDSFEGVDTTDLEKQIEDLQTQNEELKQKYKDRFLKGDEGNKEVNKNNADERDEDEPEEPKKFEDLFNEKGELK